MWILQTDAFCQKSIAESYFFHSEDCTLNVHLLDTSACDFAYKLTFTYATSFLWPIFVKSSSMKIVFSIFWKYILSEWRFNVQMLFLFIIIIYVFISCFRIMTNRSCYYNSNTFFIKMFHSNSHSFVIFIIINIMLL